MYTEHLEYFILAYEQRGFRAAAKLVPMTPQGIVKAVKSLETKFGVALFESESNGSLRPTVYADELYRRAKKILVQFDNLDAVFKAIKAEQNQVITIGLPTGVIDMLGPRFFVVFEQQNPDITIVFHEMPDIDCENNLIKGLYDLAFTVAPFSTSLTTIKLASVPFGMWVSTKNPLSQADKILIADLENNTLWTPGEGYKFFAEIERLIAKQHIKPKGILHSLLMSRIFRQVKENKAIATNLAIFTTDPLFSDDSVISLPFENFDFTFGISWKPDRDLPEYQKCFLNYVLSCKESLPIL